MLNLNDSDYFIGYMKHIGIYQDPSVSSVTVLFTCDVTEQVIIEKGDN
jgi:hypothetical protein